LAISTLLRSISVGRKQSPDTITITRCMAGTLEPRTRWPCLRSGPRHSSKTAPHLRYWNRQWTSSAPRTVCSLAFREPRAALLNGSGGVITVHQGSHRGPMLQLRDSIKRLDGRPNSQWLTIGSEFPLSRTWIVGNIMTTSEKPLETFGRHKPSTQTRTPSLLHQFKLSLYFAPEISWQCLTPKASEKFLKQDAQSTSTSSVADYLATSKLTSLLAPQSMV